MLKSKLLCSLADSSLARKKKGKSLKSEIQIVLKGDQHGHHTLCTKVQALLG